MSAAETEKIRESRRSGSEPFITLQRVSRSFGSTHAVRDVTFDLATPGTIHALVGENGAGKSTCLGLASGRLAPTSGQILVEGQPMRSSSARAFIAAGIHTIYQELTIVPALDPVANVFLGKDLHRGGWLKKASMARAYGDLCERMGLQPLSAERSGDLSIADQQMLEIQRALISEVKAILLDEPTASLAENEREVLFRTLDGLRQSGIALTLVSHNLDEVLAHCDDVTVFRDGAVVEGRPADAWTKRELVQAMLGDTATNVDVATAYRRKPSAESSRAEDTSPALVVAGLSSPTRLQDIGFELRRGEILGLAGLVGSGRTEVLRALAGLDPSATGTVQVGDGPSRVPRTVREARARGIALLPEDRKGQGLVLAQSAADNVTLGEWRKLAPRHLISRRSVEERAAESAGPVGFDRRRIREAAGTFSGGNQQKLMLARWLFTDHEILLADEPTRGVDVGAKSEILASLESLVTGGRSLIVVSSDLDELVGLCDRVIIIDGGRIVGQIDAADEKISVESILHHIFRSHDSTKARN